jgi:hypothetical protein
MNLIVGNVFNDFFNRVQGVIDRATQNGRLLEIEAGVQVRQALYCASDAYRASMNETMGRVDEVIQGAINNIGGVVLDLEGRAARTLQGLADRAQVIVNALPFADRRPQFTHSFPRCVCIYERSEWFHIRLFGNFVQSQNDNRVPSLQFEAAAGNGLPVPCDLLQRTVIMLEFRAAPHQVFPNWAQARMITDLRAELQIPWIPDGILARNAFAVFRTAVAVLPPSPGPIVLHWTTTKKVKELAPERYRSPNMHVDSCRQSGNDPHIGHLFRERPRDEWKIEKGSSQVEVLELGTVERPTLETETENEVIYKGSTKYERFDSSGSLDVTITFQEYRMVDKETDYHEEFRLEWNQSRTLDHYRNQRETDPKDELVRWSADYTAFDYLGGGVQHQGLVGNRDLRGLKMRETNKDVSFEAVIPEELI